jgi:hypothetical protein
MVLSLLPQSLRPWDTLAYVGDPLSSAYAVGWNVRQLWRDPAHLFDWNTLYPNPRVGLLAPHRLLSSLVAAPVVLASGNTVLGANVALAAALLLAAMAGRQLALRLGLGPLAAWTAGAVYAFHTYQISETARIQVVFHGFLPLALVALLELWRTGRARYAWWLALSVFLLALADNYTLLYGVLLLSLIAAALTVAGARHTSRRWLALVLPAAAVAAAYGPLLVAYAGAARQYGFAREPPVGIDVQHYFTTAPGNLVYGHLGAPHRLQQRGPHFVGFVALGLALVAVTGWFRRRGLADGSTDALLPARAWVPAAALLALLFAALSLGRDVVVYGQVIGPGPYRLLHALVPGFGYIRIPERLALIVMLFVGLLAGRGVALLSAGGWRRTAAVLAVLAPLEHVSILPYTTRIPVGGAVPGVYRWLAASDARAVAEVPVHGESLVRKETLEEYFSTFHWKPIIHGYVSYPPLLGILLRKAAADFPSGTSLSALQRVGVDTVVVHVGRDGSAAMAQPLAALAAGGRVSQLARFEGPAARVYEGTADEVYRLAAAPRQPAAPQPRGRRLLDPRWVYRTKEGDPAPAADGDLATAWTVPHALDGDEFFEITFGSPVPVGGLVLPLDRHSAFPLPFRVAGLTEQGWVELARFDAAHVLQLVDQLLIDPGKAQLGFDLGGRPLLGVRLMVAEGAGSFEGWRLAEVEVRVP